MSEWVNHTFITLGIIHSFSFDDTRETFLMLYHVIKILIIIQGMYLRFRFLLDEDKYPNNFYTLKYSKYSVVENCISSTLGSVSLFNFPFFFSPIEALSAKIQVIKLGLFVWKTVKYLFFVTVPRDSIRNYFKDYFSFFKNVLSTPGFYSVILPSISLVFYPRLTFRTS